MWATQYCTSSTGLVHVSLPEVGQQQQVHRWALVCSQCIFTHKLNFTPILRRFLIQNHQLLVCADQRTSRSNTFICRAAVWKKEMKRNNKKKISIKQQTHFRPTREIIHTEWKKRGGGEGSECVCVGGWNVPQLELLFSLYLALCW